MYQCRIPRHRHRGGDGGSSDRARGRSESDLRHHDDGDARAHLRHGDDGDAHARPRRGDVVSVHPHHDRDARFSRLRPYRKPVPSLLNLQFLQSHKDLY